MTIMTIRRIFNSIVFCYTEAQFKTEMQRNEVGVKVVNIVDFGLTWVSTSILTSHL
jgi:hypothetical protein